MGNSVSFLWSRHNFSVNEISFCILLRDVRSLNRCCVYFIHHWCSRFDFRHYWTWNIESFHCSVGCKIKWKWNFPNELRVFFKNLSVGGGGGSTKRDHTTLSVERWQMVSYVTVGGLNSPQGKFCIFPCTAFRTLSETDFWIYSVYIIL
jgi:hypothetical protein